MRCAYTEIRGVSRLLSETIYNLVDNAIKYNREGGKGTKITLHFPAQDAVC